LDCGRSAGVVAAISDCHVVLRAAAKRHDFHPDLGQRAELHGACAGKVRRSLFTLPGKHLRIIGYRAADADDAGNAETGLGRGVRYRNSGRPLAALFNAELPTSGQARSTTLLDADVEASCVLVDSD